ncbi:MAG TPA: non-ribosomal peptide synthetase, partial [Thermoanaerobaculia bacterium]
SLDLVVGLLGIWQAGGAAVPLDPGQPASRLELLLADALPAGASAVVSQRGLQDLQETLRLGSTTVVWPIVWVDEEETGPEVSLAAPAGSDLAYLLYTSGSTGRPKGVLVEHGSLAHTLAKAQELLGLMAGERMPVLAPATFDAFLFELLLPLLCGGTAVLIENRPVLDMKILLAELERSTLLFAVPSVLQRLTAMILERGERFEGDSRFPRLRQVFTGAEAVGRDLVAAMRQAFAGARLWALYGPTEAAICTSGEEAEEGSHNGIGRPLPGVTVEVRDALGSLVPAGSAGELWLGGPGLARGYLGRPELTAERFVPSSSVPGARLYRTGDRVRFAATGRLEFLGRIDQQVKVRGFRIEPGEVEAALLGCPGVEAAAVLVQDERLVAYVAGISGIAALEGPELRRFAESRLPSYMVPSRFVRLDRLPLTRHGKVDRRALAGLAIQRAAEDPGVQAPAAGLESLVASVFREVLGVEKVGLDDNFFDLGGHSLLLVEVQSRLSKQLGEEVPLLEIYRNPNAGALARALA